ncbi:MAG TPA: hypothetical protein VE990_08415 [Acidimicrobiales bacterium]|nr:hypothetical protein [Acidimicrobiales bacterium]
MTVDAPEQAASRRFRVPPALVWLVRAAVVGVVVGVVVKVGIDNYSSVRHIHLRLRPAWFAAAAPMNLACGVFMPLGWREILDAFGARLPHRRAVRIWWTAQITRYVPAGAALLAARVVLAGREGVPRVLAGATLPIEVGILAAWGSLLTAAFLSGTVLVGWARILVGVASAGLLAGLPLALHIAGRLVPGIPRLASGRAGIAPSYRSVALYGLNSVFRTFAFTALAAVLLPAHWSDVPLLAGAVNASSVAGLLSIAPGGLGVREGIMTLILKSRFGFGDAAAVSVVLRGWDLCLDVAWFSASRLAARRHESAETRRARMVPPPGDP